MYVCVCVCMCVCCSSLGGILLITWLIVGIVCKVNTLKYLCATYNVYCCTFSWYVCVRIFLFVFSCAVNGSLMMMMVMMMVMMMTGVVPALEFV